MDFQGDSYKILISKLDGFIRKYYKNQLIKGGIYCLSLFLFFAIAVSVLEYFGHFDVLVRTVLFYGFLLINIFIIYILIATPLFRLYRLGNALSYDQAAVIVGTHFFNVKDKLLNTLQLHKSLSEVSVEEQNLLVASINQKVEEIKPLPFNSIIRFSENRKYLKYAVIPIILILLILFSAPDMITKSTARLIEHRTFFETPAPFKFIVINKSLNAIQQEDYTLDVKITGSILPDNAFIELNGNRIKMEKIDKLSYRYVIKNVQKNTPFRLFADGILSKPYELKSLPNPLVLNFNIHVEYPAYLKRTAEDIKNTGDLIIPEGSVVKWSYQTRNAKTLKMSFKDSSVSLTKTGDDSYIFTKRFIKSDSYSIVASNEYLRNKDSIVYAVNVIPDLYPSINVEEEKDSLSSKRFYFKGSIKDDYGFTKLSFNYRFLVNDSDKALKRLFIEPISFNRSLTQDQFFYMWDLSGVKISPNDQIEYYFEVFDNDGVHGSKSARSQTAVFKAPSLSEIAERTERNSESIKEDIRQSVKEAKQLQKDLQDFSKKLFEKKELGWDDKKKAEDFLNRQRELEKKIGNIQKENEKKNSLQTEYKPANEELLEKQRQLNEMMDKLMTEDMKRMMEEMQKMLEKTDKNSLQEQVDKMKFSNKELEKELDRSLEIFKQMEFSQKMDEVIQNLDKLAQKEEELSKQSLENKVDNNSLKKKQEELTKEFQNLSKDLDNLEKKNEELEFKNDFKDPEQEKKDISEDMENSEKQMSEGKSKKASQSQKSASSKMAKMSDKLKKMQQESEQEQAEEDINSLRSILENLLRLSFSQEQLMNDVKTTDINNPKYLKISQQQRKLKDDSRMIEDSLLALSKRVIQIQSIINKEISSINQNMDISLQNLEERQTQQARSRQQFSMTSVNNLALLLSEVMQSMQEQMAMNKPGNSQGGKNSCKKPGSGSPSLGNMKKLQQQLNEQMKAMKDGMKKGNQQGKGMSEQMARLAAQQEMIRNEINKLNQQGKDGKGGNGSLGKIAEKMEQTETDLVNKILNQETLNRQQEILSRLLESEKAENERELDNKRESNEAKNSFNRNPSRFEEYKKAKQKEMEMLKTVPPALIPFYRKKVDEYFQKIEY